MGMPRSGSSLRHWTCARTTTCSAPSGWVLACSRSGRALLGCVVLCCDVLTRSRSCLSVAAQGFPACSALGLFDAFSASTSKAHGSRPHLPQPASKLPSPSNLGRWRRIDLLCASHLAAVHLGAVCLVAWLLTATIQAHLLSFPPAASCQVFSGNLCRAGAGGSWRPGHGQATAGGGGG